jgi:N-acyl-D-amino-acid deacylase
MIYDIENGIPGWDNFVEFAGLDGIFVTSVKNEKNADAIGLNLTQLGQLRGKDAYNATFDLLYEEENAVGMVDFYGTEEHVQLFMKRPEMNCCTDGLLGGKPHPRVFGAFPRILGKYVREDKALTLEEAIYKMTKKPATTFNMTDRGELKEGYYADITVFDESKLRDGITDQEQSFGIEKVYINGINVLDGDVLDTEAIKHSGRAMRS